MWATRDKYECQGKGLTPLLSASFYDHASAVGALCVQRADPSTLANMNFCSKYRDYTALDVAAIFGYVDAIQTLLKHGPDVNAEGPGHQWVLNKAAERNPVRVIDVLMEAGVFGTWPSRIYWSFQRAAEAEADASNPGLARHSMDPDGQERHSQTPPPFAVERR